MGHKGHMLQTRPVMIYMTRMTSLTYLTLIT
jgi:hypothetical protein